MKITMITYTVSYTTLWGGYSSRLFHTDWEAKAFANCHKNAMTFKNTHRENGDIESVQI